MKTIPLTRGMMALVDDADFEWLNQWKWCAVPCNRGNTWYAMRRLWPSCKAVFMHQALLGNQMRVDHINTNGLDNQRHNLRRASNSQNGANRGPQKNNTTGFKGVVWLKRERKFRAGIKVNQRYQSLGDYRTAEEAARIYDAAAIERFGEFAWLNFPQEKDDGCNAA